MIQKICKACFTLAFRMVTPLFNGVMTLAEKTDYCNGFAQYNARFRDTRLDWWRHDGSLNFKWGGCEVIFDVPRSLLSANERAERAERRTAWEIEKEEERREQEEEQAAIASCNAWEAAWYSSHPEMTPKTA